MADVFISYAREDVKFAHELHDSLVQQRKNVWIDWNDIPPSIDFMEEIYLAIEGADNFVFIISSHSIRSRVCQQELNHAVQHNKRLLPVVVDDIQVGAIPEPLRKINWISFRSTDKFDESVKSLVSAIDADTDRVRIHTRVLNRAVQWKNHGIDKSYLLRGSELRQAEKWLSDDARVPPSPTPLQTQYVIESRRASMMRQGITLGAVTTGLLITIILLIVSIHQRNAAVKQSRIALSRQLAHQSYNHLEGELDLALLMSLQACSLDCSYAGKNSLLAGLLYGHSVAAFLHGTYSKPKEISISPDTRYIAVSDLIGNVELFDATLRQPVGSLRVGPNYHLTDLEFSPCSRVLATGGSNGVQLWSVPVLKKLREHLTIENHPIEHIAFDARGETIAFSNWDGSIGLWELGKSDGTITLLEEQNAWIADLALGPDVGTLAACLKDSIVLWDVEGRSKSGWDLPSGHGSPILLSFSTSGDTLASLTDSGVITLWDVGSHEPLGEPQVTNCASFFIAEISPTLSATVFGFIGGSIWEWDLINRTPSVDPRRLHNSTVTCLDISQDGNMLVSCSEDGTILMWDLSHRHPLGKTLESHKSSVTCAAFSPAGNLLVSGGYDSTVLLWNVESSEPEGRPLVTHGDVVSAVAISPDGRAVASSGRDSTILIWDLVTQSAVGQPIRGHLGDVRTLAYSPDGKTLACGGFDGTIRLWDLTTQQQPADSLLGHEGPISGLAFSEDGRTLVSCSWNYKVILWDLDTYEPIQELVEGHESLLWCLAMNPAEDMIAVGSRDGSIILWDLTTYERIEDPPAVHRNQVRAIAFSPDGMLAASGSDDGMVALWDASVWEPIGGPFWGHRGPVGSLAFSYDGTLLASASGDGTIILWDVDLDSWKKLAREIANRPLTIEEISDIYR